MVFYFIKLVTLKAFAFEFFEYSVSILFFFLLFVVGDNMLEKGKKFKNSQAKVLINK